MVHIMFFQNAYDVEVVGCSLDESKMEEMAANDYMNRKTPRFHYDTYNGEYRAEYRGDPDIKRMFEQGRFSDAWDLLSDTTRIDHYYYESHPLQ